MTDTSARNSPSAPVGEEPRAVAARQRLERLDGFLRHDPANNALLIDAFETALSCADWVRARHYLDQGRTQQVEPLAWRLREGDFWLAQESYDEAKDVLEGLMDVSEPPPGFADVLLHNLAYIEFRQGRYAACAQRLGATLEAPQTSARDADGQLSVTARALQQVWLRALHHDGQFERAMAWTERAERESALDAQAAGIASLIAIDAADFSAAQLWSTMSLQDASSTGPCVEALVTQASLALAAQDAQGAARFADAALQRQPGDGRAWSTRGFAALLASELTIAADAFGRALAVMGQHVGTWHGLGWTRILQGDLTGAQSSFATALELDRNFAESHGGLAVVYALLAERQKAQVHAETALRLDRSNLSGRYAQALLSGEMKDPADVLRFARRLLGDRAGAFGNRMADALPSVDVATPPPLDDGKEP
ncbi:MULTISPECIES: hypothetical protein [Variovorax]|jgi:tetratricopeptide (TPR) repeat protein|uniref:hypothetical protein n=1 Tax=Variovorax TaxID=34072 RepID=UPI00086C49C5|nr:MULTISPECIES: hypothetical protein [Variovorax]MBN8758294.1 hypothetical protein [Variovorax sp.]ODU12685.1 MAG: hypothetical protein ABS94_29930 [Variovorax sp. SCN 67-85]ODV19270.1 MAG: hypothetical protein ABT25_26820 [Variovorax sp. SCN 67-20]OJZ06580.1 MAG: hypothetical protein BGP22_31150 [Variovorax sp. 67-131]UKI07614.1 hypothetical protein L3V85_33265 [Variovorax paradoxus]